jgi:hypothetical protein
MEGVNKEILFEKSLLIYPNVEELSELDLFSSDFKIVMKRFKELSSDIFSCYNFMNEFPKDTFLSSLFETCKLFSDIKFTSLSELLADVKTHIANSKYSSHEIYVSLLILFYLYLKETVFGGSFFFIKETEKVDYLKEIHKFNEHEFFKLDANIENIKEEMINYFTVSGEAIFPNTKMLLFFIIPYEIITNTNMFDKFTVNKLWSLRLIYQQQKLIKDPIGELKEKIFNLMKAVDIKAFEKIEGYNLIQGLIRLEFSYYYIKYYKYKECEDIIEEAKNLIGLKIALSGRMGKKTKYQEDEIPILVVESESSTLDLNKESTENNPTTVKLDEENPLLEVPNITDDTFLKSTDLSLYDQIYINSLLNYFRRSLPDEDLLREIIVTYCNKSMGKSFDWLVYSKILIAKCQAEDKRTKTIERCLLQIQSLCDQYNDRSPSSYERLKYYFSIDYPTIWNLKKIYAEAWMNFGAVMTAFDIFKEIDMYEECIQCLYIAGKNQRAQEFADEILKKKEDPGIYCILGELQNKEEYFFKALEVSKNKYTRAYRCLGKHYFVQKK